MAFVSGAETTLVMLSLFSLDLCFVLFSNLDGLRRAAAGDCRHTEFAADIVDRFVDSLRAFSLLVREERDLFRILFWNIGKRNSQ